MSVIIPSCNGRDYLEKCIPSIIGQMYRNLELVLVDNGSSDGSVEFTKTAFPDAKFVCNARNFGFAAAVNQGVRSSSGEYVFILNNDTALEPDCIQALLDAIRQWKRRRGGKVIGVAPKILLQGRPIIDSVGNAINPDGTAYNVGIGQVDLGQFDEPTRVIGACFAAAFIERSAFDRVGFLDESYFAYYEDVDWCYRANVLGYEFYSAPGAVLHHHHSGSARTLMTSDQKYYLIHRNMLRTVIKNYYYPGNLIRAARRILIHSYHVYDNSRRLKFGKVGLHAKIVGVTFLWLPILLAKNFRQNRGRASTDYEIWEIASERVPQIRAFDPETYSPFVTLDVMEEVLHHLALNVGGREHLDALLCVQAINYLVKVSSVELLPRLTARLTSVAPKNGGLLVKGLGHRIGGKLFITHKRDSYLVDQFLLNLILIMNGRTLDEVARVLVENAFTEKRELGPREVEIPDLVLPQVVFAGLRWIAAYLAKLGLIEGPALDALAS